MARKTKTNPSGKIFNFFILPRAIWILGIVSFLMSTSSVATMILAPVFVTEILGATTQIAGIIEGMVEAAASFVKIFSGTLSDMIKKRKILMIIGYGISACIKPIFAFAPNVTWIFTGRMIDRVSNGLRDTPRDALLADLAPPHLKGSSFGLRTALSQFGSLIGAASIIVYILFTGIANFGAQDFRTIFMAVIVPSSLAIILLIVGVKDVVSTSTSKKTALTKQKFSLNMFRRLSGSFWAVVLLVFIVMTARFGEGMIVLRTNNVFSTAGGSVGDFFGVPSATLGLRIMMIALILIAMNVMYSFMSYPMGKISDRLPRSHVLIAGCMVLALADYILAMADSVPMVITGVMTWGLHMGMTQGVFAAMLVDKTPDDLRGTAFGFYNLAAGFGALFGNAMGGHLWHTYSPRVMFTCGMGVALVACLGLFLMGQPTPQQSRQKTSGL